MLDRETRGLHIAETNRIMETNGNWIVPSQSGRGTYKVRRIGHDYKCSCPDCQFRMQKCKHIWAVEYWTTRRTDMNGNQTTTEGMRVTYAQNWHAYNEAQTKEKAMFMKLLAELCSTIEQKPYAFGRPKLPLSDMIFCSTFKIFSTFSGRRFVSDMEIAKEQGYIDKVPHFNSVFNYLKDPELTPILKELIIKSSLPLKSMESDFAVDSTGFSTCQFARWFDFKYGREKDTRIWLKAHIMCGTKTNIVTSVEVTEGTASDSRQFKSLVSKTAENFSMEEISADKAYSSRDNLKKIKEVGATPYIPFKTNTNPKSRGCMLWSRMYHFYNLHRDEFIEHYHKRSNVETTMHMIKAKFGTRLRSKTRTAQTNELLAKVLSHNICCVIQELHELRVNLGS